MGPNASEKALIHSGCGVISRRDIQRYCNGIAGEFRPERIILFGSQAYGHPTTDSDVDLLVILPFRGNDVTKAIQIRSRFDMPFPLDLIVRKPDFIADRLRERDMFIEHVMTRGVLMYEEKHA
jgi:predicted nucleotidyltransferase